MSKILNALKSVLPDDQAEKIAASVESMVEDQIDLVREEYEVKLRETHEDYARELKKAETIAENGYAEAYSIIQDQVERARIQKEEFEDFMEEQYREAKDMLVVEREKNDKISEELHDLYESKFAEAQDYLVNKIHDFMLEKGSEIYEQAKQDLLKDPEIMEHKMAFDKIVNEVANYVSFENSSLDLDSKLNKIQEENRMLQNRVRTLESKNVKVSNENMKLNEQVKKSAKVLKENNDFLTNLKNNKDKKLRMERLNRKKSSGKGRLVVENDNIEIINEHYERKNKSNNSRALADLGMSSDQVEHMKKMAGIK